ncbi:MAG TPA: hypothetical protein PK289_07320 [Bacteroidia bacterium]|nr:hypothetical protein [Bacteroidia bacterium]
MEYAPKKRPSNIFSKCFFIGINKLNVQKKETSQSFDEKSLSVPEDFSLSTFLADLKAIKNFTNIPGFEPVNNSKEITLCNLISALQN